jgi:MSHA biogenesis protein MshQ
MSRLRRWLPWICLWLVATGPVAAAVSFVSSASSDSGGSDTSALTIPVPPGTSPGDLLVAHIAVRGGSGTTVAPTAAGWAAVFAAPADAGTKLRQVTYVRVAGSAESATYTWTVTPGARAAGAIAAFRGVDTDQPVNASSSRSNASSTTITIDPVTTTVNDTLLVALYSTARATTHTRPAGMTEAYDASTQAGPNGVAVSAAYVAQNAAGSSGSKTATAADAEQNIGQMIALKPLAVLRADYHFDECSYSGAGGEVRDSFGSFHATARNGTTTSSPGRIEREANFDRYDRWIETSIPLARDWSVTAWFEKPFVAGSGSQYHVLAAISGGSDLLFLDRNANYQWGVYTASPSGQTNGSFRFGTLANGWHHLALVGVGGRTLLYVDNVLVDQVARKAGGTLRYIGTSFDSVNTTSAQGFRASLDEFMVWDHALNTVQIGSIYSNQSAGANYDGSARASASCGLDHVRLLHDGSALTCQPENVTVQACADAACAALYTGSVTTTLSPTGWIGTDTISFSGGSTTVQLRRTTPGTTTLGAAATVPTPARAARCFMGLTEDCALTFADSGFVFDVPNLTACKPSAPVVISAVRKDDATQRCVPGFASGTRNVAFWSTYTNPISGTRPVLVNAAAVTGSSPGTNVSLNFDANAQASFTVTYADAGQMQLAASFTGSGAEAGLVMTGSDSFVSVPTGLAVYSDDPKAACTPASATCSVLARAGDVFALKVKAACWQSDGDTDLSDNPATPNFRMSGVPLSATLVPPAGGAAATLGTATFDFVAADAGIHTVGQTVSEVGVFRFSATPSAGAYFGATVPGATSANIGRFIPHHFTVAAGSTLTNRSDVPACTSAFTYMGEPLRLDFTLRAENASGGLTQNYAGSFAKLELTQAASFDFAARNGATNLAPRLGFISPPGGSWSGGLATVAVSPTLARAGAPDGPYTQLDIGVAPRDADGVALLPAALDLDVDGTGGNDHLRLGRTEVRFGRARLDNAYGSELLDLPLALRLQHWNGQGFVDSPDDACTRFAASDFTLVFPSSPKNLLAACETVVSLAGGVPSALRLTRPGAGNSGWADLRLNLSASASGQTCLGAASSAATTANKAYLQGRWSGASYDQDPTARASFGTYRASGNLIYLRENY